MTTEPALLVSLDLAGTFTYALNGGLTAVRAARLDIVGVVTLAMVSGLGGGIIRDILLGALPPATFSDWRYLAVAAAGGLAAFGLSSQLVRLATLITVLDAAGLGLFAVTGASKALGLGLGAAPAVILGAITGAGGGTLRDVLLGQIPSVLRRGLYVIPALCAAVITVAAVRTGTYGLPAAVGAVLACFLIRVLGVRYDLNAPMPPEPGPRTRRSRRTKADVPVAVSKAARHSDQGGSGGCGPGGSGSAAGGCEQAEGAGGLDGVCPAVGAELGVQAADVALDGVSGYRQLAGDFRPGQVGWQVAQHADLAAADRLEQRRCQPRGDDPARPPPAHRRTARPPVSPRPGE